MTTFNSAVQSSVFPANEPDQSQIPSGSSAEMVRTLHSSAPLVLTYLIPQTTADLRQRRANGNSCCPLPECNNQEFSSHVLLLQHFFDSDDHQLKMNSTFTSSRHSVYLTFYRQPEDFCYTCPCDTAVRYITETELRAHLASIKASGDPLAQTHTRKAFKRPSIPSTMTKKFLVNNI
jgi:hypothetical protein